MSKLVWAAVVLLVSVAPAMAQVHARASVFVAGSFVSGSREFLMNSNNALRTEYANSGKLGFRVGVDLSRHWAADVAYSYGGNNLRAINLNPTRKEREFSTRVHQFLMNGSYYIADSDQKWRPFGTFGLGFYRFIPTEDAKGLAADNFLNGPARISSNTKFGVNLGGGVEGKLSDAFGVRFDVRDHVMGIPRFGLPETPLNPGGVSFPISGTMNNLEVGVGFVVYFH